MKFMSSYNRKERGQRRQSQNSELYLFSQVLHVKGSSSSSSLKNYSWKDLHLHSVVAERIFIFIFFMCCCREDSFSSFSCVTTERIHLLPRVTFEMIHFHLLYVLLSPSSVSPMCCCRHHLYLRCVVVVTICISNVSLLSPSASSTCRSRQSLHLHVL